MNDTELRRVEASEVSRDRFWHLPAVFEIEKERVEVWLREAARRNLLARTSTAETALTSGESLPDEVGSRLKLDEPEDRDPEIRSKADRGELERLSPSRGWLRTLMILKWVFILSEVGLFALQWAFGISSGIVIVHGLVLAFAAFLVGWSVGMLWIDASGMSGRRNGRAVAVLVGGLLGVLGIASLRASGGGEGVAVVIVFTLVLASLIILFEALHVHGTALYRELKLQMFKAQQWVATDQHYRDRESGLWKKTYERFVREMARERDRPRPLRDEAEAN